MDNQYTSQGSYVGKQPSTFLGQDGATIDMVLASRILRKSYAYMSLALIVSGIIGIYFAYSPDIMVSIAQMGKLGIFGLMGMQLAVVWYLSARVSTMSVSTALGWFLLYAALTGVTLAFYLFIFTGESVATIFFISAAMFGACSAYGYFTNKNIMGWSSWLMVGLIGVIASSLINMVLQSEAMMYVTSGVCVLLFCGLTAYDTQKLLVMSTTVTSDEDEGRVAVIGALTLYLDFINLFLALLRIFGSRK